MTLAFVFPGQGSQKVGMTAALLEDARTRERLRTLLALADATSGLPVGRIAAEGPEEELTRTDVAQPALFCVSVVLAEAARAHGLRPAFVAGHSLGEYSAAAAAGAVGAEDGVRLVCERGRLMAAIQEERPGGMAALVGADAERARELCDRAADAGLVRPANLNAPTQVVVSGESAAIERVLELAAAEGLRAVRLAVGAAFHSELMEPVRERMRAVLAEVEVRAPEAPLVSNASAELVTNADAVREALLAQIASPVRWVECVERLRAEGVDAVVELGPGRVLGGLVRQIDRSLATHAVDAPAKLAGLAP